MKIILMMLSPDRNMKILLFLLLPAISFASNVTVNTLSGTVIGSSVNFKGKSVKRFLGIPFAEPPVGDLRFKKTVPVSPWSKPLAADTLPPSCVQTYPFDYPWVDRMSGDSEDCLYLNIWVPESASSRDPKAVMFWIFSGGFSTGSNRLAVYDGQVLAAEGDVVVVTINYRLGIFGFLSTESEDAPGNMGLFDVLEALKWVNSNIQTFGGDKNKITVFGNSAGSMATGYLTISPLSTGLYQRIILESGSPAIMHGDTKKRNLELGQQVAAAVGCASVFTTLKRNPQAVVACLRKIGANVLTKLERSFKGTVTLTFLPVSGDKFLPVEPREAIRNGKFQNVDVLAGNVNDEGSIVLVSTAPLLSGPYGELNPKISKTMGRFLILQAFQLFPFKYNVADYYLSNLNEFDFDAVRNQVFHSSGDFQIICPTIYFIENLASKIQNVYYYYFEHQNLKTVFAPWMGVTHFSEVPFVFGRPLDNSCVYTKEEKELSKRLIKLWTSFAKDGVPSAEWSAYTKSSPYAKEFYIQKNSDNYLKQHQANCEFFRSYFGF